MPKRIVRGKFSRIALAKVPDSMRAFVKQKFGQINRANWPPKLKADLKKRIFAAARSEGVAREIGQPKPSIPHGLLVELYANTVFKEFNRLLNSSKKPVGLERFIAMRKNPPPVAGIDWYGAKPEIVDAISKMLKKEKIPPQRKNEIRAFVRKNQSHLTEVQLHRVLHYIRGLSILHAHGLLEKNKRK